jgi:hypothetical protein
LTGRRSCSPAFRKAADELIVVDHDYGDDGNHQTHRLKKKAEVAVKRLKCCLYGVGHRGNGIGHYGHHEGDQQNGTACR